MKHWVSCLLIAILSTNVYAKNSDYHSFTDVKGRTIEAKITDCDPSKNQVTLELKGTTRSATIPINSLSQADQTYIKEWYISNESLSPKKLRISSDEVSIKKWEKTKTDNVTSSTGRLYAEAIEYVTKYEQIAYSMVLQNNGTTPLEGLRIEYKLYYEQSQTTQQKKDPEELVYEGTFDVPLLAPKKRSELQTEPVEIQNTDVSINESLDFDYPIMGGKGKVYGMRARIYLKLPSGKEAMREFSYPESLSSDRYPWEKEEDEDAADE